MNYKYKVLWLDDDFEPISTETNFDENLVRKSFQEDVETAKEFGIDVVGVRNYEEFCAELENIQSFQAVIFDLKGMEKDNEITDFVMPKAMKKLQEKPNLPTFVYSANTNSEKFIITLDEIEKSGRCFPKALGVEPLYNKILEVLGENMHHYAGHPECIIPFQENWLRISKREMDEVMKCWCIEDNSPRRIPFNEMRKVLEEIMRVLKERNFIHPESDSLNDSIKYIKSCKKKENGEIDYYSPSFSHEKCPQEIKYLIDWLNNEVQKGSHLNDGDLNIYHDYFLQCVFNAFFAIMKWYTWFIENVEAGEFKSNFQTKRQSLEEIEEGVITINDKGLPVINSKKWPNRSLQIRQQNYKDFKAGYKVTFKIASEPHKDNPNKLYFFAIEVNHIL